MCVDQQIQMAYEQQLGWIKGAESTKGIFLWPMKDYSMSSCLLMAMGIRRMTALWKYHNLQVFVTPDSNDVNNIAAAELC